MTNPENNIQGSENPEDWHEREGVFELKFDPEIVAHNLTMLNNDMVELIVGESIGGNAGTVEINGIEYACAGANGIAESETGKITAFGNIQNIDKAELKNNARFIMKIALGSSKKKLGTIADFQEDIFTEVRLSDRGKENIRKAIEEFNEDK